MFINAIAIGIGILAPTSNLANISTTANEIRLTCEFPTFPKLEVTNFKLITLTQDNLHINIFQLTEGAKLKIYKKIHLSLGFGAYYVRKSLDSGFESSFGSCSYYGFCTPILFGANKSFTPEFSYYTAPRGISITIGIGIKL